MRQILGDNQFFGINHNDLSKGAATKSLFPDSDSIYNFINASQKIGLNGFMINSNDLGYKLIQDYQFDSSEIHYSVPYPHKYATLVNEKGMTSLISLFFKSASFSSLVIKSPRFLFTRDIKYLLSLILDLEIPKNLPKGSYVYLQNIVTDLVLGLKRPDLLEEFCKVLISKGYFPGLITLNLPKVYEMVSTFPIKLQKDLIICFNINRTGFNVFPSKFEVEETISRIKDKSSIQLMGMSILSSGGDLSIEDSLAYIKGLNLDYVVYGSSKLDNIKFNFDLLKN